jgi:hypothetical protein
VHDVARVGDEERAALGDGDAARRDGELGERDLDGIGLFRSGQGVAGDEEGADPEHGGHDRERPQPRDRDLPDVALDPAHLVASS